MSKIKEYVKKILGKKDSTEYFWNLRNKSLHANNKLLRSFYGYKYHKLMIRFCCSIPLDTAIEGMPIFPHGLSGIFISQGATIGKNVVIYQHVTIGSNTLTDSKNIGAPLVKNNVLIGAGAKIIGNLTVGANARIGANAVVVKDVQDNATVVLSQPRVINHEQSRNNAFVKYNDIKNKV